MSKIIEVNHLSFSYAQGSHCESQTLKDVTFSVEQGEFLGIFGPNGSGKSTLAQHFNGLLRPTRGSVTVCGIPTSNLKSSNDLWQKAGLVFQYPEQQIFQVSVFDEVAYGPRNLGLPEIEIKERVWEALFQVGLSQEYTALSPVTLSGGMRRRVAIAGILAIRPEILILDEPMAGLDAIGRKLILDIIHKRKEKNETTIMVSHNLQEIMTIANQIVILKNGSLAYFGNIADLLNRPEVLADYRLELPEYLQVIYYLASRGINVNTNISNIKEAGDVIRQFLDSKQIIL